MCMELLLISRTLVRSFEFLSARGTRLYSLTACVIGLKICQTFFYDFVVRDGKLHSVFWADEISKLNYKAFGDVVAFDATYNTNK